MNPIKDIDGKVVQDGDTIRFAYGIPPVGVVAKVIGRNGKLIALTPGHKPAECELVALIRFVGSIHKVQPSKLAPTEVEAKIFRAAGRSALTAAEGREDE